MNTSSSSKARINMYQTGLHECGYYPDRQARSAVLDPDSPELGAIYPGTLALGFRRSGQRVYRPLCPDCNACIPTRIAVSDFRLDRSQRRCLSRNDDVQLELVPARFTEEYFSLYTRYLDARHQDSSMANPSREDFESFLSDAWDYTRFLEIRQNGCLLAVAVVDISEHAMSAIYTFYEPSQPQRSLGTLAVLKQVSMALWHDVPYVYLGYWLPDHPKMDYKRRFSGLQILQDGQWQTLR